MVKIQTEIIFHPDYLKTVAIMDFKTRLESLITLLHAHHVLDNKNLCLQSDFIPISIDFAKNAGHTESLIKDISQTEYFIPALLNCGGVLKAIDDIQAEKVTNAFITIPVGGHHAGPSSHWGFCYLNEVACAVHHLREKYNIHKILYIDQDYHHGDGVDKFFHNDPDFFFIDSHAQQSGQQAGVKIDRNKNNIDITMPKGIGGSDYASIIKEAIDFTINKRKFEPEYIIVYAGFDSHISDDFNNGNLRVDHQTFVELTKVYKKIAEVLCKGRLLCITGGGYNSKNPMITATCMYNTIMVLANNYQNLLDLDKPIEESDAIAHIKVNTILKDIVRSGF